MTEPLIISHYLDREQAARELGVSTVTLDRWRKQGSGPPYAQMGRTIVYSRDVLADWLRSQFAAA